MAEDSGYDDILGQMLVAFGAGAQGMRVTRRAIAAFRARYSREWFERRQIGPNWDTNGVQILERVKAIGRAAAAQATNAGQTKVDADDLHATAKRVEAASDTIDCRDFP